MTGTSKGRRAALGIRFHSGWAAAILVSGSADNVEVIDRRRIALCDPHIRGSKQPFHAAEPMPFGEAEVFVARCRESTEKLAAVAVDALVTTAHSRALKIAGCGVLSASGRALPSLREIVRSHARIHAAEGDFYRDAMAGGCAATHVPVLRIRERDVLRQVSDHTQLKEAEIRDRLTTIGKRLGPPWTEDQKLATLAAWIAVG